MIAYLHGECVYSRVMTIIHIYICREFDHEMLFLSFSRVLSPVLHVRRLQLYCLRSPTAVVSTTLRRRSIDANALHVPSAARSKFVDFCISFCFCVEFAIPRTRPSHPGSFRPVGSFRRCLCSLFHSTSPLTMFIVFFVLIQKLAPSTTNMAPQE